jgi:hypothetical protein
LEPSLWQVQAKLCGAFEHAEQPTAEKWMTSALLDIPSQEIERAVSFPQLWQRVPEWCHPTSEAERLGDLEDWLSADFDTFREVCIEHYWMNCRINGRVDLLAVPKARDYANAVLAFEVKRDGFDVERALKQSADYVGGRVVKGRCYGKRITACFLYPSQDLRYGDERYEAMFQLVAQWRVGRGYMHNGSLWLSIGQEVIWDSRGWHEERAERMLLSKRTVGGTRREFNRDRRIDLKVLGLVNGERFVRRKL